MSDTPYHPRRSCLYMPASNERALEKAKTLSADTIIFDLEDSVAPGAKDDARDRAYAALASGGYGRRELVVRVNATDTPWFAADMERMARSDAHAILVPKVTCAEDITEMSGAMDEHGANQDMALWVMIEMPLAVLNIAEIAEAAEETRLTTFVMGFNDLAKEMRAEPDETRAIFMPAMSTSVMAARAHGLTILDSVYNDFNDPAGLTRECKQALQFGFDGKSLIHPAQIEIANSAFAPNPEKIAEAKTIITAFQEPENAGKGVITVNGRMTELLHLKQAEATVAMAEAVTTAAG